MNPSGIGGLAEGIAGGVQSGMQNYLQLVLRKIDKQQQADIMGAEYDYKLFANPDLPIAVRKKAWKSWQKRNKNWNIKIESPDFPDDMWNNKVFNDFAKKGLKIISNKDYSLQEQMDFLTALHAEAVGTIGAGKETGVEPLIKGVETKAFAKGIGGVGQGKMTPETRGLLAMTPKGRGVLTEHAKPAPLPKQPAISMYVDKNIGQGKSQKFQWNPKTRAHDIPFGEPTKSKVKTVYRSLEGNIYKITGDKSTVVQEGSLEARAIYNAMREPQWSFIGEAEQFKLVDKHKKFLTGKFMKTKKPGDTSGEILPRTKGETISQYLKRTGR
jgi:hypothetical protein